MPAPLVPIAVIVGFGLVTAGIRWLNEGRPVNVGGLFPDQRRDDWPHGVQEPDVPRFRVDHADRFRPSAAVVEDLPGSPGTDERRGRVALRVHRFAPNR